MFFLRCYRSSVCLTPSSIQQTYTESLQCARWMWNGRHVMGLKVFPTMSLHSSWVRQTINFNKHNNGIRIYYDRNWEMSWDKLKIRQRKEDQEYGGGLWTLNQVIGLLFICFCSSWDGTSCPTPARQALPLNHTFSSIWQASIKKGT